MAIISSYGGKIRSKPELRFVTTVMTGGRVKFVPAVLIFPKYSAFSCVEVQDLHSKGASLHRLLKFYSVPF